MVDINERGKPERIFTVTMTFETKQIDDEKKRQL